MLVETSHDLGGSQENQKKKKYIYILSERLALVRADCRNGASPELRTPPCNSTRYDQCRRIAAMKGYPRGSDEGGRYHHRSPRRCRWKWTLVDGKDRASLKEKASRKSRINIAAWQVSRSAFTIEFRLSDPSKDAVRTAGSCASCRSAPGEQGNVHFSRALKCRVIFAYHWH
jgi:hypothetical protein